LLEEIEEVADTLNREGADAFERGRHTDVQTLLNRATRCAAIQGKVRALRAEWQHLNPAAATPEPEKEPVKKADLGRLNKGKRTPDDGFRLPLLLSLIELGGSGFLQEVTDLVGEKMRGKLNEYDLQPLPSDPNLRRWRNTVAWLRFTMVEEGLLRNDSPRGTWEISDAGRKAAEGNGHPNR
jgi:hypothetical protein